MEYEPLTSPEKSLEQKSDVDVSVESVLNLIDNIEETKEKKEAVKSLVESALEKITQEFGRDGEGEKSFHDQSHTIELINDASRAFDFYIEKYPELIEEKDRLLVILAGAFHDTVQYYNPMVDPGRNEKESAIRLIDEIRENRNLQESLYCEMA